MDQTRLPENDNCERCGEYRIAGFKQCPKCLNLLTIRAHLEPEEIARIYKLLHTPNPCGLQIYTTTASREMLSNQGKKYGYNYGTIGGFLLTWADQFKDGAVAEKLHGNLTPDIMNNLTNIFQDICSSLKGNKLILTKYVNVKDKTTHEDTIINTNHPNIANMPDNVVYKPYYVEQEFREIFALELELAGKRLTDMLYRVKFPVIYTQDQYHYKIPSLENLEVYLPKEELYCLISCAELRNRVQKMPLREDIHPLNAMLKLMGFMK